MKKVILADNQFISRSGWYYLLQNTAEIIEVSNKKELLSRLVENIDSLVIVDYTLFDFESVNDLIILQQKFTRTDWIIFSEHLSIDFLKTLLYNTNSFSILLKDGAQEEITMGLHEVLKGNRYICNEVSNSLLTSQKAEQIQPIARVLTATEQEILKEMAMGKTTKEIAAIRFVSVHTIMTHRKNIFRKIEVNNIHEATKYAMRAGIVDLAEYYI